MNYGDHRVPAPLQDEDKWFKLTKRQWVIMLPAIALIVLMIKETIAIRILPIGVALSVLILILALCLAFFELPPEKYLFGSGVKMEKLFIRIVRKRLPKNKVIYTKNYNNGYREWKKKL